ALWTRTFTDVGTCPSYLQSVVAYTAAVGPAGEVFAMGNLTGAPSCSVDFGKGPLSQGSIYVVKLDAAGSTGWSRMYGATFTDVPSWPVPLAVNGAGDLLMSGSFSSATLDLGTGLPPLSGTGGDFFLADVGP